MTGSYYWSLCVLFACNLLIGCGNFQDDSEDCGSMVKTDFVVFNGDKYYQLDHDLMLNRHWILDNFTLRKCKELIAIPDSIHFGGPEIIAEFGADDYVLFYGKSIINAGHGHILMIEIRDETLKVSNVGVGSHRSDLERALKLNLPAIDTVKCLGKGDGVYHFIFRTKDKISAIEYFAPPI